MNRILADAPERSNGALTVVALAIEGGRVPRNALTQRHTDLKEEYYRRIRERGTPSQGRATASEPPSPDLKKTIDAKNKELARLREDVPGPGPAPSTSSPWKNQQLRDTHAGNGHPSSLSRPGHRARPRD